MISFYYLICNIPKKGKYHAIKLIFMNNKLENNEYFYFTQSQINNLLNKISANNYSYISNNIINLDSFLKHVNLFK